MTRCGRSRQCNPHPPPQPQPERKRTLSPTRFCLCSCFLSHRRLCQSLPPYCTSCIPCLISQRLEELERWDKILHEEIEARMVEFDRIADVLLTSVDKLNIEFRLEEINRITAFNFDALLKKKAHINPEIAEKAKALMHNEAVENLYDDGKASLNKQLEELRLKKERLQRNIVKIPKQSKFFRDVRKLKKKEKQIDDDDDYKAIKIV